ncbi:MAG: ATP-binding protein [Chloroflexaceae bacterium]|jgi:heavy metal sensor kinase|nr:ATP-binding protein [Chloroflexaceae bacterium]
MSLRTRLTLSYTAVFAVSLLALGLGIFFTVRQMMEQGVQEDLKAGTNQIIEIYNNALQPLEYVISEGELRQQAVGNVTNAFGIPLLGVQIFNPQGNETGRTENLRSVEMPLPSEALNLPPGQSITTMRRMNGTNLRTQTTPIVWRNGNQIVGYVQVSRPMDDVDNTLGLLLSILIGGGTLALLITAAGVAWLSRRAMAPLDQVTHTAENIVRAEDLAQRVPVPNSNDELQRLTITINELLGRLESLFLTQRRFVADVSHELRTPLAAMQGNLEVLTRGACNSPELLNESLTDMRRETTRLTRMVNDLLLLAQSDMGVQIRNEPVELDSLLLEVHRELRPLAGEVSLRIGAEDQILVQGDRDRLKQALLNLGANAIQHTAPGGSVTLGLERRDSFACVSVADTGEGIAGEDLPKIFERFYRADRSRSRHVGGAGLGLSIVKRIVEAHGGQVTVASIVGRGSTFAMWLPLPAAPALPLDTAPANQELATA